MNKLLTVPLFIGAVLFTTTAVAQDDNQPMNAIQVIGSHNSYRKAIEPQLYDVIQAKDPSRDLSGLQYDHIEITKQLDMGLRNLEIDIHADTKGGRYAHPKGLELAKPTEAYNTDSAMDKPGFKVFHMLDIDYRTWYSTFDGLLADLKKWSDAHPTHEPIFITLEPKDGDGHFGTTEEEFTQKTFDEMDKVIITGLGANKLITPDMVRGKYKTLEEAVLAGNWPKLKQARGKFMFLLDNSGKKRDLYIKDHPSLRGRVVFVNAAPGTPEAAALFRNNPEDATIAELAKKGYIIRTRADADTKEARANDYSHFEAAKKSGAQIITTDYYLPSKIFQSPYHISFDNKTYVRTNPVTGKVK
ncbi:phosphatidylinositol-specific phospholipase C1-like protein [Flavobacterium psychrotrophum]|uniref:phosphatidylinositol-specific phospholipase C1-like protein n=1 Tax=Flavobacterium psychrotrophum TaxID=2294119 RepID=UPI000E3203C4|nr:phosphatidylinositol-specific phospholipase C1-like protein [Flavobacterium psychrotrophum]